MTVIRSQCKDDAEYRQALRDDFAAAAMNAILISGDRFANLKKRTVEEAAFEVADGMLAEREKS
jgi:hypothetical protein